MIHAYRHLWAGELPPGPFLSGMLLNHCGMEASILTCNNASETDLVEVNIWSILLQSEARKRSLFH